MKILYITSDAGWGGSSVALYNLVSELKNRHQIYVFLPSTKGQLGKKLMDINVMCFSYPFEMQTYPNINCGFVDILKHIWWFVRDLYRLHSAKRYLGTILDDLNPDIVHLNVGMVDLSLDACLKRNICHVWHLRDYLDYKFFPSRSYLHQKLLHECNYNIAITKQMFKYYGLRNNRDIVVYDGVINALRPHRKSVITRDKYFLMVGTIQEIKGILEGIKAFHEFDKQTPGYKLLIAGRSWKGNDYKTMCDNYINRNDLRDKVNFIGERNDVYELMSQATALLAPNKMEGFGFTIVEAMYNQCIVIGRNVMGLKEQFELGFVETGNEIAFHFDDDNDIPKLMLRVVNEDLSEMRERAYNMVSKHYTVKENALKIEAFYKNILLNKNSPKKVCS